MTLTYKYWHGGDWRTSSWLIAMNKLQRFICDKKQNSGIGISYNNECLIQNCDENNMSSSMLSMLC